MKIVKNHILLFSLECCQQNHQNHNSSSTLPISFMGLNGKTYELNGVRRKNFMKIKKSLFSQIVNQSLDLLEKPTLRNLLPQESTYLLHWPFPPESENIISNIFNIIVKLVLGRVNTQVATILNS